LTFIDRTVFSAALFLLVLGLIFEAAGFGVLVAGRLDGVLFIVMGASMFWGGWAMSGARGLSCAVAAALNMFDAASTVSFWNFEVNPIVKMTGPTAFMAAKIVCSVAIMLYAKIHRNPEKGGLTLTAIFSLIVGWNLGQHALAYLGYESLDGLLLGTAFSFAASALIFLALFASQKRGYFQP